MKQAFPALGLEPRNLELMNVPLLKAFDLEVDRLAILSGCRAQNLGGCPVNLWAAVLGLVNIGVGLQVVGCEVSGRSLRDLVLIVNSKLSVCLNFCFKHKKNKTGKISEITNTLLL